MTKEKYKNILNRIINYAPIESGIQTLVYMFLDDLFENSDYDLLVIDRMQKKSQYETYSGVSDIAVIKDCMSENNDIICYIEVKAANEKLNKYELQLLGQLLPLSKAIITNGKEWICYDINWYIKNNAENIIDECWANEEINSIQVEVNNIIEKEKDLAKQKSSLAHTRTKNEKIIKDKVTKINELENIIKKKREKVDSLIENSDIIKNVLDHPRINISLVEDNLDTSQCLINTFKYTKLITKLYDFINDI